MSFGAPTPEAEIFAFAPRNSPANAQKGAKVSSTPTAAIATKVKGLQTPEFLRGRSTCGIRDGYR
jgi:hypothetical protein